MAGGVYTTADVPIEGEVEGSGEGEELGVTEGGVGDGVEVGTEVEIGVEVGTGVTDAGGAVELDGDELLGGGLDELGAGTIDGFWGGGWVSPDSSSSSSDPPSNTTKFALDPSGTVTTQKLAPPAPSAEFCPSTSFTLWIAGSIAHGRPLQCPSHSIFTPHVGILSRNGVAGSR